MKNMLKTPGTAIYSYPNPSTLQQGQAYLLAYDFIQALANPGRSKGTTVRTDSELTEAVLE